MTAEPLPMGSVRCRLCGAVVALPEDSEEARAAGRDPLQVLRRHLKTHPGPMLDDFVRQTGLLLDLLAFEPDPEPARAAVWRRNIDQMVTWFLGVDLKKSPRETTVPRETLAALDASTRELMAQAVLDLGKGKTRGQA